MPHTPIHELPFDAFQRYQLVADLVQRFPSFGPDTSVLDVGGRTALMRGFLPQVRVDLVDVEPDHEAGLVIGSGGALPFRDGAFDVVTACDTLEHVPQAQREAFVKECARVSRGWVILAGPYASEEVRAAESALRDFMKRKLDLDHRYLNEHFEHGLPCRAATEAEFGAAGCSVVSIGHASLQRWLPLMCLEMYMDSDPHLREVAKRYFNVYNRALYASDHADPVYRHAVVAAKAGVALPAVEGLFEPPVAPPRTIELFDRLIGELTAFDCERDVYEAERARLRAVNDGLHADLRGHVESLATVRADLEAHREALRELTLEYQAEHAARVSLVRESEIQRRHVAELQLHARKLKDVNRDIESDLMGHRETVTALREELNRFHSEYAHVLSTVQADLAAHRDVLGAHEAELDARACVIGELNRELTAHRAEQTHLIAELAASAQAREALQASTDVEIRRLREELAFERERNAALTQDLADRWKNFRRAIEPRRHA